MFPDLLGVPYKGGKDGADRLVNQGPPVVRTIGRLTTADKQGTNK